MAGPGRNYYLYYDLDLRTFKVLTWDLNLAFSGDAAQGPYDAGGFGRGGFDPGGAGQPPGGFGQPPGGGPGQGMPGDGAVPPPGGGFRMGNKLKERFLATPRFKEVYEAAYRQIYQQLYANGGAVRTLTEVAASIRAAGDVDPAATAAQVTTLRTLIDNRTRSLATNAVIQG
jgi:spore coat protein CotH